MKIFVLSTATVALLAFATTADAQNNRGRAGQPTASVQACVQANADNNCQIQQSSGNNVAASVQAGRNNNTGIVQDGGGDNKAIVNQLGNPLVRN